MVKVAWKVVNGYGPYAYLQESVKSGGKVTSKHIAYLGKAGIGKDGVVVVPGKHFKAPPAEDFPGGRIFVPLVGDQTEAMLKPNLKAAVQYMEEQAQAGAPMTAIISGLQAMKAKPKKTSAKKSTADAAKVAPNKEPGPAEPTKAEVVQKLTGLLDAKAKQDQPGAAAAEPPPPAETTEAWYPVGKALGSTPGGIYKDQNQVKYYLKIPKSLDHVQNELLARDLYKLAGLKVPTGYLVKHEGKPALVTDWMDSLTGSGTNPKDLQGTKEGFVADAWLANWDSVGVGTTKYDNILSWNGEAIRVDTGGALQYHGTGAPKGHLFGLEVTELDKLRDPKVNPVAATVYGDMTFAEIKKSAEAVSAIPKDAILEAVKDRFKHNPQLATDIGAKLLIRQTSIKKWIAEREAVGVADDTKPPVEKPSSTRVSTLKSYTPKQVDAEDVVLEQTPTPAPAPKIGDVPVDNKGKPLISKTNVKKLEKAAAEAAFHPGHLNNLKVTVQGLADNMKNPAKKAAIMNAGAALIAQVSGDTVLEGDGGSGLAQTVEDVKSGKVQLPEQDVPNMKVLDEQNKAIAAGRKNYYRDLVQVSGKKGSNEGGLFKDKKLETLHYIKWPNSETRAKVEALTALLYAYAQVPVPTVRTIKFNGKDAVMSDWIDDTAPTTTTAMRKHKDVREGFGVDAWLANWDVVGLSTDNIVKGPGKKAYRIDLGGSMLFRAQGKPKPFPTDVGELTSLLDAGINPQSSKVFAGMSKAELKAAGEKVAAVTDTQIDEAVDLVGLPKKSADYPAKSFGTEANDLPKMLKARLKARRDFITEELLNVQQQPDSTAQELSKATGLKVDSVDALVKALPKYSVHSPSTTSKWENTRELMREELGKGKGASASNQTKEHYKSWKGASHSPKGTVLRWAAGEMYGEGRKEQRRQEKFNKFLVARGTITKSGSQKSNAALAAAVTTDKAQNLVRGVKVAGQQNEVAFRLRNPGKKHVTLYRGWKGDQMQYLKTKALKVGDQWTVEDPPLYSWSTSPNVAQSFVGGHGAVVTKAEVPIDKLILSDLVNSVGSFEGETEVVFKGVPNLKMEVTKTY